MKWNRTILAAMALALPLSAGIGSAYSYFTANAGAQGSLAVEVGSPETEIKETVGQWTKHVTITNTGDIPVYVRVQAFSGSQYPLTYTTNEAWNYEDSYYVYNAVLSPGETTTQLDIKITGVKETDKDNFNVIVVYERTPVRYSIGSDGKQHAQAPDWNYSVRLKDELQEGENE